MSVFKFTQPCYSIKQVEQLFDVSRSTVNRWINAGKLDAFSLGPNSTRITTDSLEAFLSKRMMSSQMSS